MGEVAIKLASLKVGDLVEEVVGLVTTASGVSSMSERLADKLHIGKQSATTVDNMRLTASGYLPNQAIDVTCVFNRKTEEDVTSVEDMCTVTVAFVILPSPFNELVLGSDWMKACSKKFDGPVIFSSNPPTHKTSFMHIGFGHPTPGPGCEANSVSLDHLISVKKPERFALNELVEQAEDANEDTH